MSKALLVIAAVVLEGRSKSDATRDYGLSRYSVQQLVERYEAEGPAAFEPRSRRSKLLASPAISDGFAELWERGRLDLTVEAAVVDPKFAGLFTPDEIEIARKRLEQFG